jgi:hypothetical protein
MHALDRSDGCSFTHRQVPSLGAVPVEVRRHRRRVRASCRRCVTQKGGPTACAAARRDADAPTDDTHSVMKNTQSIDHRRPEVHAQTPQTHSRQ